MPVKIWFGLDRLSAIQGLPVSWPNVGSLAHYKAFDFSRELLRWTQPRRKGCCSEIQVIKALQSLFSKT
ncbi:MAG: hypothetical protein WAM28_01515 [Chlamydiales bacterium]